MIERFYTTTATKKRMVYTNDKSTLSGTTTFNCHIQMAGSRTQEFDATLKISHIIWCQKDTDVKVGDVLEVGSIKYKVKFIETHIITSTGENQHKELACEITA
jgi:NhaP-type Na+/H+ and K+/H+ antiporter